MNKQLLKAFGLCCIFLLMSLVSAAQKVTISGRITDEQGQPLPGSSVLVKGTKIGQVSDNKGAYSISINNSSTDILVFSMVGFTSKEIKASTGSTINVQLKEEDQLLNEVVVVGYGTQRRRDLTGSVASVKGDEFKNQPITNATEALQGRIAGVNIVKSSGAPDATPSITIRGLSSLYQPDPLYIVDGIRVTDVSNVNVQDIESMDVLKDAAAASIYGAAAAGGVILITTKKGTTIDPVINYNNRFGITTPKVGKLLDKDGYIKLQNIINPTLFAGAGRLDTLANTDWIDETFNNAVEQNHNISLNGSTPVVNYLVSGFYNKQKGVARKNFSNIGGARINTDYKLGKIFKFGEQLSISRRSTSNPQNYGVEAQLHNSPFRTLPIVPLYNSNGAYGTIPTNYPGLSFSGTHPVGAIDNANVEDFRNNMQANIYGEVKLPLGLTFRSNVGYSYYNQTFNFFQNAFSIGGVGTGTNSLTKQSVESQSLLTNFLLSYIKTFDKHNISAVAGFEQITQRYNNVNVMATNVSPLAAADYAFIATASSTYLFTGQRDNQGLVKSFFGRVNYNYNGKYYLSGSIRQDANFTVFGPNKQKGVFPAASAGWTISEEPFFKTLIPAFNSLKFRASYGELGNSNIGQYAFLSVYQPFASLGNGSAGGANFSPGGTIIPGVGYSAIPNPDLHWETIKETNIGLDGSLLNNKLYFSAEYYNKATHDMLYNLPMAPSAGVSQPYLTNIGTVSNKGFELLLGYKSNVGAVGFDLSFTGAWNKNEVTKLSDQTTSAFYNGYNFYNNGDLAFQIMPNQTITITQKGLPFGSFYGYKSLGIFQTDAEAAGQKVNGITSGAGDLHFQDLDGNGEINSNDRQVIGNPNPKLVYGINMRFNYKGFDAAFLFNGVAGVDLFNGVKAYEMRPFADGNTSPKVWGASFLAGNGLTDQPRLGVANPNGSFTLDPNGNYSSVNSYFVEKGDYLKLKNLQIGYTFSNTLLQKIKVNKARIFVMGNNLFTITKYSGLDPELGASYSPAGFSNVTTRGIDVVSQYPQTKIYSVGIDVTF
ncbi:SusC/RagA family TonB-linked outer membrane protein [Pedobacter metabolipauper]|uniref:TonB-linked SusC/RagA family outer membrane protein n=1 Tax=Pedobacter metabolipauper TaxID=425513 RepID=A0A4R6SS38_9SPHI|nr:TonB-dependent receptor [Pedobacter metabolipauper]TDQ06591.1 TonB-linked SusC/RagA family outer membrane protein [Pedobacter metabolipauper]